MKGSTYDNHTSTNEVSMCVWKQHMGLGGKRFAKAALHGAMPIYCYSLNLMTEGIHD